MVAQIVAPVTPWPELRLTVDHNVVKGGTVPFFHNLNHYVSHDLAHNWNYRSL